MKKKYKLIFSGKIKEGYQRSIVQKKLAMLLKKDEKIIAKLFSGTPKIIMKNADWTTCQKIQKTFLSIGALTIIEEMIENTESQQETTEVPTESEPQQQIESPSPQSPSEDNKLYRLKSYSNHLFGKTVRSIASLPSGKQILSQLKNINPNNIREAKSSIEHDFYTGGLEQLIKNRLFHYAIGAVTLFFLILFVVISYENNPMPLTKQNIAQLASHIAFIEKSFTVEGLEKRSKSKKEYLEYLIVEPVEKSGYNFSDTLDDLVEEFLDDNLQQDEQKNSIIYLRVVISEKNSLQQQGLISNSLARKLEKASQKITN